MAKTTIGITIVNGQELRRSIRERLVQILGTQDSILPREFSEFRAAVSIAIKKFDETLDVNALDHGRTSDQ